MTVEISRALLARLRAAAEASPGLEICGLLFGDADRIVAAEAAGNVAPSPADGFEIDPAALIAAHRAERSGGPRLIGHYHSHPGGTADPSPRDAAAAEPGRYWLILGATETGLWLALDGGEFRAISVEESCAERMLPPHGRPFA